MSPVSSVPASEISPLSGLRNPLMMLNRVVLPAPFGPSTPTISPGFTAMSTESSAVMPPKLIETSRVSSSGSRASIRSPQLHEHVGQSELDPGDPEDERDPNGRATLDQRELLLPDLQQAARTEH